MTTEQPLSSGLLERIGLEEGVIIHKTYLNGEERKTKETFPIPNHTIGLKRVAELLTDKGIGVISNPSKIKAVGHRLVHGGEAFTKTVFITDEVKAKVKELFSLAPLRNPANLTGVEVAEKVFPNATQIGVFDTAFHQTMADVAFRYAILEEPMDPVFPGRARMLQNMPYKDKRDLPQFPLSDSQVSLVVKDYYSDESFCRNDLGNINLWKLFNLFTGANKMSYIDNFSDRNVGCQQQCTRAT